MLSDPSLLDDSLRKPVVCTPNDEGSFPCALAMAFELCDDRICHHLIALYPITMFELISSKRGTYTATHEDWRNLSITYVRNMTALPIDEVKALGVVRRDGWVGFVSTVNVDDTTEKIGECIKNADCPAAIKLLASLKDRHGRSPIKTATSSIKGAMAEFLFFLGRYDLAVGPPLHQSATSIVIKAYDRKADDEYRDLFKQSLLSGRKKLGKLEILDVLKRKLGIRLEEESFLEKLTWYMDQSDQVSEDKFVQSCKREVDHGRVREVVVKFMKEKGHFQSEVISREQNELNWLYVVGISERHETIVSEKKRRSFVGLPKLLRKPETRTLVHNSIEVETSLLQGRPFSQGA